MALGLIDALKGLGRSRHKTRKGSKILVSARAGILPTIVCELVIDAVAARHRREISHVWTGGLDATVETLRACSLTCRAWTPRSQYHLFHFLTVQCSQKRVEKVVALLTRNPALESRIAVLVLKPARRTLNSIPPVLSKALPRVSEIRISQATVTLNSIYNIEAFLGSFAAITTLNLFACTFQSANDLRRVVAAMSNLRTLVIDRPEWRSTNPDPPHLISLPTGLRLREIFLSASAVWLEDARCSWFIHWLALSGAVQSLTMLVLIHAMIFNDGVLEAIRGVVEASAGALEELSWSPGTDLDYSSRE